MAATTPVTADAVACACALDSDELRGTHSVREKSGTSFCGPVGHGQQGCKLEALLMVSGGHGIHLSGGAPPSTDASVVLASTCSPGAHRPISSSSHAPASASHRRWT